MTVKELLEAYNHNDETMWDDDIQIAIYNNAAKGIEHYVYEGRLKWFLNYPDNNEKVIKLFERVKQAKVESYTFDIFVWGEGSGYDFKMMIDIREDL